MACCMAIWPTGVSVTPLDVRSSNWKPVVSSKSDKRRLAADKARWQAAAPCVMLPVCTTAQNKRSVTKSTRAGLRGQVIGAF